ncbi:hypothetical protein KIPB_013018 [Kipferlia bialata]|uniref:Uncharacterized protein n=1 Tax=Kipferlia bialata TaxID=797122 RepID=A0A9K3GPC9_9EUKA|nr:hypothetical protein KIPB_013018 [Kipferlia bialata]|eukprot:g13018.t1
MNQDPDMLAPVPVYAVPVHVNGTLTVPGSVTATVSDSGSVPPKRSKKTIIIMVSCILVAVIVAAAVVLYFVLSDDDDDLEPRNGQVLCYDNSEAITCPASSSEAFYFQVG